MQIQIADEVGAWLEQMAAADGKSAEEYANAALLRFLEDREDYLEALEAKREMKENGGKTYTLEEVSRELGLDD